MLYALIRDGAIAEVRIYAAEPEGAVIGAHPTKPYLLPIEDTRPEVDPVTEVEEGPAITILEDKVTRVWTVRAKNSDELAAMRQAAVARIAAEFRRRWTAPITYLDEEWDADEEAVMNVQGVVTAYLLGDTEGFPRPWTPRGTLTPVLLSWNDLKGLGIAMKQRKDALFFVKKQKQAAVAALTDAQAIHDYDVTTGWE